MIAITLLAIVIIIGCAMIGTRGGLGSALCSSVIVIMAMLAVPGIAFLLSGSMPLTHRVGTSSSQGMWQIILFVALAIAAIPLGAYLQRFILFNVDPFDNALGLVFGVVMGLLVMRFILISVLMAAQGLPLLAELEQSFVVRQIVYLDGWHAVSYWMMNLSNSPKPDYSNVK